MTLQDALGLHRAGRFSEAEQAYRQLLAVQPSHPHALHYYGVLRAQLGDMAGSAELVRRALTLMPDDALAHFHLAEALRELGGAAEAAEHFAAATRGRPDFAEAYAGLAAMLVESKAWDPALAAADKALALKPELAVAAMARGRCLSELQRLDEALSAFDQAIALAPGSEGLVNRGWVLFQLGRFDEALAALDQALAHDPGATLAHSNRGSVLMALGRSDEALAAFQQGLAEDPTAVAAYYNFGAALLTLGRYDAAVAAFDSVLALAPAHGEAAYNKARALELSRNPNFLTALEQAAAIAPDLGLPASRLFVEKSLRCDWRQRDEDLAHLLQLSRDGQLVDVATVMGAVDDPALHLQAAKRAAGLARAPLYRPQAARRERLRIGYLSPDFRNHPVAHQIVEVLERHDRARFEVIGLCTQSEEPSPIRARLIAAFTEFHELEGLTDQALAEKIAALDLDILIDLGGYTQMTRLTALAAKPAPVTVEYLGYPGTTGAAYIDYILADAYCLPPQQEAFYSEKIVRLPGCFFPA
ncbi:MAG: tetratricopeptide repeat protein, partial [Rhizomicrobium sp.]|nr:tetratricopeptide repeat protein [Rhizomicrobium sp.]